MNKIEKKVVTKKETKKEATIQERKHNARIYPFYKMCSWDLLFYYAIAFVFLVQTKGMSASEVMFTDAMYPFLKILFQMPALTLIDKVGKRNSLIIGNLCLSICLIILIFSNGIPMVILSYAFMALAFAIKNTAESNLLYDSIPDKNGKGLFAKIEEKGARNYYILDGITSMFTGFLFIINGYVPMIISLMFTVIAIAISTCFKEVYDVNKESVQTLKQRVTNYLKDMKDAFKFIFQSRRLQAIMVFVLFFGGLVYVSYTLRESLLDELEVPSQFFSIILASLTILSGITAGLQDIIHKKLRNRALTFIGIIYIITFVMIGIVGVYFSVPTSVMLPILLVFYAIQYAIQSPYEILISKYLKSFATPEMRIKISTTFDLIQSISSFAIAMICSYLLDVMTPQFSFLVIGIVFGIIIIIVLYWMKDKFGLKPGEYRKQDIQDVEEEKV